MDLNRLVTKMIQKNGGTYTYQYDAVHRLTGITTPLGLKTTLTYDVADNIVKQADSLDRVDTFEYDIMHRMTKSVNAEGGITTYGYDIRGNQNELNDALGYTWNYQYDLIDQLTASVDPEGKSTEFAYNLVGEIEAVTKPGERKTSYTYDGNYNVVGITDPKGYLYEYSYDKDDRLIGTKNPLGESETIVYDAGSRVTSITDRMGLTEKYTYDPHGNVIQSQATNGLITKFSYDILDNLVKVTLPSQLTASYTYDVMGNVTSATDTMNRVFLYTYDVEGNMTSVTDYNGRTEQMAYDEGGRLITYTSNGGNKIHYDYDRLNDLVEKSYEDAKDPKGKDGVIYAYDVTGQRVSMMDRSGESTYEYDGLGRITKVTTGSGEVTSYTYDEADQLSSIIYADGKSVSYEYDKNDNLVQVTDRTGAVTTYVYDEINRVTEIHRPNGVSTYNTYNARDQIVSLKNICDDCGWVVSQYDYTYDDRGFIVGETAVESLYGYTWDDKHDGKHENGRHDDLFPHGNQHTNKHAKDGEYNFQIVETVRSFEYDDDGKLLRAVENEEQQGQYIYTYQYDDMGNRTFYSKTRNGVVQESAEYTYNASNQIERAKIYDGKKNTTLEYTYDADGNLIAQDGKIGTDKVELTYIYSVENRLKAVYDADELLVAMAYDGDGNRIFQLNYNLHTDDDWKGNSGNGNGNNKDNAGNGNSTVTGTGTASEEAAVVAAEASESETEAATETDNGAVNGNKDKDKGNNGNDKNNGVGNGNGNSNSGNNGNGNSSDDSDAGSDSSTADSGTANGNTTNTGGSTNQSSILFPIEGEVSELEQELIDMIKTEGKEKNYELIEYVNDVNREYAEVLLELNINGIMDTAYTYGNERLTNERFTGWTGYYTYDPRGSVSGITDSEGMIWQSYRYDGYGNITFGKPEYNNVYAYNAESYNPNVDVQYLRARYYCPTTADFLTEDTYLGNISDPLTLNRYNYVKSSPLNYTDPSGHSAIPMLEDLKSGTYQIVNDFIDNYLDDQGRLKIAEVGTGKDRLEILIQVADENGEIDFCEAVEDIVSLAIGMNIENSKYWSDSFNSSIRQAGKILDSSRQLARLLGFGNDLEKLEEEFVFQYLDPNMYYTGKYLADVVQYMIASKESDVLESLLDILSDDLNKWTSSRGRQWVINGATAGMAVGGFFGGTAGSVAGPAGAGSGIIVGGGAGTAIGGVAGAGSVIIIGLGETVVITGAQISLMGVQNTVDESQKSAENNAKKSGGDNTNPDVGKIIDSASQPKKGGETVAGHALQKHAGRNPNIWGKVSGNSESINNAAMKHIDEILNAPGEFKTVESNGRMFLEKVLPDGRGIRLNMDGTFKGFIDQIR